MSVPVPQLLSPSYDNEFEVPDDGPQQLLPRASDLPLFMDLIGRLPGADTDGFHHLRRLLAQWHLTAKDGVIGPSMALFLPPAQFIRSLSLVLLATGSRIVVIDVRCTHSCVLNFTCG